MIMELFAGPGGVSEGLKQLGLDSYGIDISKDACATARAAGHQRYWADVAAQDPRHFGPITGLIGTPPCQGLSATGPRKGLVDIKAMTAELADVRNVGDVHEILRWWAPRVSDPRSLLILEPLRWALATRPEWIMLEQVPSALPVWQAISWALAGLDYSTAVGCLKFEQFGLPQTRRRAVLLAHRSKDVRLPTPTHHSYDGIGERGARMPVGINEVLAVPTGMVQRGNYSKRGKDGETADQRGRSERLPYEPSLTITSKNFSWAEPGCKRMADSELGRRATMAEVSVLQSFPADYPWQGTKHSQYQQSGDAVPPMIARQLLAQLV